MRVGWQGNWIQAAGCRFRRQAAAGDWADERKGVIFLICIIIWEMRGSSSRFFSERLRGFSGRHRAADGRSVSVFGQPPGRSAENRRRISRLRHPVSVPHDRRHIF